MANHRQRELPSDFGVVLGAGFSAAAGLPTTKRIAAQLLKPKYGRRDVDFCVAVIRRFLADIFDYSGGEPPSMEDLFTMIDLAANSGHHLGSVWTPAHLRSLRRLLIYRIFDILDRPDLNLDDDTGRLVDRILTCTNSVTFVATNWDIVLENRLSTRARTVDYCIDAVRPNRDHLRDTDRPVRVIKVHGSANWLYCDNCKQLFYDLGQKVALTENATIRRDDYDRLRSLLGHSEPTTGNRQAPLCTECGASALGPHLATFSLEKSFRTHAFDRSLETAHKRLKESRRWLFVGYSLPDADYTFRHLLKGAQLAHQACYDRSPEITVVLKSDQRAESRYRTFFGRDRVQVHQGGVRGFNDDDRSMMPA